MESDGGREARWRWRHLTEEVITGEREHEKTPAETKNTLLASVRESQLGVLQCGWLFTRGSAAPLTKGTDH